MPTDFFRPRRVLAAALALGLAACETAGSPGLPTAPTAAATAPIPAVGTSSSLDFGTWNIEWFGDTSNGPSNETLQLENVRDVVAGTDLDIWGLQEVVNEAHFKNLVSQLSGYSGFLANDPLVTDGAAYYSDFNGTEQKVGLLYKTSVATVQSARIILTAYDYDFAGRPPLEVKLAASVNGTTENLVVIVLHAKAGTGGTDYDRRKRGSEALKAYLDSTYPTQKVIVIGDFNDDVDVSIVRPKASPYANFVADSAAYRFPTAALSAAGVSSTVTYPDVVDHHLGTNEFWSAYLAGSAEVLRVDQYIADYGQTTSDHYPVATRYTTLSSGGNAAPTASFTYACSVLACGFTDASTDSDGSVASWSWSFGDGATSTAANPSHTYAAGGTYTVALTVTDDAGATGTTSQIVTVSSSSSGGIRLSATGYKVKGTQHADLTWSGATSTSVDVFRNGARVATTANDGAHTDNIGKSGGGTYAYKVCEAGTTVCSNEASVTF
ncbi:MAG TPA: PKD domain-containing protein [Longimicrobiaceae bacterium]|nr:PKD domain-containing protein [Longimicrobiaceae bacterium]